MLAKTYDVVHSQSMRPQFMIIEGSWHSQPAGYVLSLKGIVPANLTY